MHHQPKMFNSKNTFSLNPEMIELETTNNWQPFCNVSTTASALHSVGQSFLAMWKFLPAHCQFWPVNQTVNIWATLYIHTAAKVFFSLFLFFNAKKFFLLPLNGFWIFAKRRLLPQSVERQEQTPIDNEENFSSLGKCCQLSKSCLDRWTIDLLFCLRIILLDLK